MKHVFLSFLALMGLACTSPDRPDAGGAYRVRIPLPDSTGAYHLQTVTLHSVTDINKMSGSVADIKNNAQIRSQAMGGGEEAVWINTTGFTPAAHFVNDGSVLHPTDFDTLVMTTTMYHFESLKNFYDQYGANEGLSFPRHLMMNVDEVKAEGVKSFRGEDNASYISGFDAFVIQPYNFNYIPLAMNGGILAHEYLHSVFYQKLSEKKNQHLASETISQPEADHISEFMQESEPETKSSFTEHQVAPGITESLAVLTGKDIPGGNDFIFLSLNEGIADFFGYLYSGKTDFFKASLPLSDTLSSSQVNRDLKVFKACPLSGFNTTEENFIYRAVLHPPNGAKGYDPHAVGAAFGHLLYIISQKWGNDVTAREVLNLIDHYTDSYVVNHDTKYFSMSEVLPLLFLNHKPDVDICNEMRKIYSTQTSSVMDCLNPQ